MKDMQRLEGVLRSYITGLQNIYGEHLSKIILYGSYARGDFSEDSDIDIMILVDLSDDVIKEKSKQLSDLTFDINFDNELLIMPVVKNSQFFQKWVGAYPFFNHVNNEGIELYAA